MGDGHFFRRTMIPRCPSRQAHAAHCTLTLHILSYCFTPREDLAPPGIFQKSLQACGCSKTTRFSAPDAQKQRVQRRGKRATTTHLVRQYPGNRRGHTTSRHCYLAYCVSIPLPIPPRRRRHTGEVDRINATNRDSITTHEVAWRPADTRRHTHTAGSTASPGIPPRRRKALLLQHPVQPAVGKDDLQPLHLQQKGQVSVLPGVEPTAEHAGERRGRWRGAAAHVRHALLPQGGSHEDVDRPGVRGAPRPQDGLLHPAPPGDRQRAALRPKHGQQRRRPPADPQAALLGDLRRVRGQAPAVQPGGRQPDPAAGLRLETRGVPPEPGLLQVLMCFW